jgi:hypothetical protein
MNAKASAAGARPRRGRARKAALLTETILQFMIGLIYIRALIRALIDQSVHLVKNRLKKTQILAAHGNTTLNAA